MQETGIEKIAIGVIVKPHGLEGECAVSLLGKTLALLKPGSIVSVGTTAQSAQRMVLEEIRPSPKGVVCRFAGCVEVNAAERLRAMHIFAERKDLPGPGEKKFYHFTLEGLTVMAQDGTVLGRVAQVINYPTVDALEVAGENGGTMTIPLTSDSIVNIDTDNKTIVVNRAAIEMVE